MLKNLLVLSFCIVATHAAGQMTLLTVPKGLTFQGNESLPSTFLSDFLAVSMGFDFSKDAKWSGVYVTDPFELAKRVVVVYVDGVNSIDLNKGNTAYELIGGDSAHSLDSFVSLIETKNLVVNDIALEDSKQAANTFTKLFSEAPKLNTETQSVENQINYINALSTNLNKLKQWDVLVIRVSLKGSENVADDSKAIGQTILDLNKAIAFKNQNSLVIAISDKSSRAKRAVEDDLKGLNLAKYYSPDYPVIFNIIFWFMVTFVFSLLAISYAIGSMDPGRDSIIYRMTSTRMKKDN